MYIYISLVIVMCVGMGGLVGYRNYYCGRVIKVLGGVIVIIREGNSSRWR